MSIKRLFAGIKLLHFSVYTEYRSYENIPKSRKIVGREKLREVLDCICKHVGKGIVESPGGVVLDGVGYFFIWKVPRKTTFFTVRGGEGSTENYNYHTGHHMYLPTFIPTKPKVSVLQAWAMDKTFHSNIKSELNENLKNGKDYRMYVSSMKNF